MPMLKKMNFCVFSTKPNLKDLICDDNRWNRKNVGVL
jgi:hypothetical protein